MKICFVAPELSPYTAGGIGVMLRHLIDYWAGIADVHVLPAGFAPDATDFHAAFPKVTLHTLDASPQDLAPQSGRLAPAWAYTTHPNHHLSLRIMLALTKLESQGTSFDVIEFPDWNGLGFCTIQERLAGGSLQKTQIAVRLHSTDGVLRSFEPHPPGAANSILFDMERKCLRDADMIIAHLPSIARFNQIFYGFDCTEWNIRTSVEFPPIYDRVPAFRAAGMKRSISFSGKFQECKRADVFVRGVSAFLHSNPETEVHAVFFASATGDYARRTLRLIPSDLRMRFSVSTLSDPQQRFSAIGNSIAVFPSVYESFCLAAHEALLAGATVVLNHCNPAFGNDSGYWIDGKNCLTFDGCPSSLAAILPRALDWIPIANRAKVPDPQDTAHWRNSQTQRETPKRTGTKQPLVSVIVPYFNLGPFVHETVASIRGSHYSDIEVLIIDDGSTDPASVAALESISNELPDLRIYRQPTNMGLAAARNRGVELANGEYVLPLDADDLIDPGFIGLAVAALENASQHEIVVTQVGMFTETAQTVSGEYVDYAIFIGEARASGLFANRLSSATALFRRSTLLETKYDERLTAFEDWDLYYRLAIRDCRFIVLNRVHLSYRRRGDSMFNALTERARWENVARMWCKHSMAVGAARLPLLSLHDAMQLEAESAHLTVEMKVFSVVNDFVQRVSRFLAVDFPRVHALSARAIRWVARRYRSIRLS